MMVRTALGVSKIDCQAESVMVSRKDEVFGAIINFPCL